MMEQEAPVAQRFYEKRHSRLVYIGTPATPEMWDSLWRPSEDAVRAAIVNDRGTRWVVALTRRFVALDRARILEGGCGLAYNVAALRRAGYRSVGIDFAPETVSVLGQVAPELGVFLADVRSLPFADNAFDGYWSLGVIEHFYQGYQRLAHEMVRVIRPGGYLFLTFPCMSPLRRLLARFRRYRPLHTEEEPPGFYQFALDPSRVAADFEQLGFLKRHQSAMSGLEGLKDKFGWLGKPLRALHAYTGRRFFVRALRAAIERLGPLVGTGHSCVLVLQKQESVRH
jgi:SAM-dependent methyltransferase